MTLNLHVIYTHQFFIYSHPALIPFNTYSSTYSFIFHPSFSHLPIHLYLIHWLFINLFIHSSFHPPNHLYSIHSLFIYQFILSFINCLFTYSFIIHPCIIHQPTHSFIYLFIHNASMHFLSTTIHSYLIHSLFINLFIHTS